MTLQHSRNSSIQCLGLNARGLHMWSNKSDDTHAHIARPQLPMKTPRRTPADDAGPVDSLVGSAPRLAAVLRSGLLDSEPEEAFDGLVRLAARLLGVPAAFVSVVDAERDFYKSAVGFGAPLAQERELAGRTFCHYTLEGAEPLVIDDTHSHPVWRAVPTVESLGVRAYVGVPITLDDEIVGSFCVIDMKPREWTADELETMNQLGISASREVALRGALATARAEAARSNALALAREEILAVVAHDLRTPLQVLALGTQVVQRALRGEQEGTTTRMHKAVDAMKAMADSLLSSTALMAPSVSGLRAIDSAELIRDAVSMMSPIAERAGIALVLGATPSARLRIDYSQFLRVLGNLIGNSIKYSAEGSTVVVSGRQSGASMTLEVRDNGKGMSREEQARAFDRGWQGAEGMTRGDGAGLGLSIARTLVEQHDGAITIDGAPGEGTIVTITLACEQPSGAGPL